MCNCRFCPCKACDDGNHEEPKNWAVYFGCSAWFSSDGYLEIVEHTKTLKVGSNSGPVWTVLGENEKELLISVNMTNISSVPKKNVRILSPLL